jgi:hypothetical protein
MGVQVCQSCTGARTDQREIQKGDLFGSESVAAGMRLSRRSRDKWFEIKARSLEGLFRNEGTRLRRDIIASVPSRVSGQAILLGCLRRIRRGR